MSWDNFSKPDNRIQNSVAPSDVFSAKSILLKMPAGSFTEAKFLKRRSTHHPLNRPAIANPSLPSIMGNRDWTRPSE
jgi:hypothetical protein